MKVQLIVMWNCDRGNILSSNIRFKLVAPEDTVDNHEIEKWLKSR